MNADILYSADFPHGTPAGFVKGCHGSHCPAVIPCRDVYRRYNGDYAFRRMIDAGLDLNIILIREQEAARAALDAERAARRAKRHRRNPDAAQARTTGRTRRPFKTNGEPSTPLQYEVVRWHSQGLTDGQIADKVGKSRDQVRASRRWLGLPANLALTAIDHVRELHKRGMTDIEMARELAKNVTYISALRRKAGLTVNKNPRWKVDVTEFRAMHATGLTDRQLGLHFGVDARTAAKRRRRLDLPINHSTPANAGVSS